MDDGFSQEISKFKRMRRWTLRQTVLCIRIHIGLLVTPARKKRLPSKESCNHKKSVLRMSYASRCVLLLFCLNQHQFFFFSGFSHHLGPRNGFDYDSIYSVIAMSLFPHRTTSSANIIDSGTIPLLSLSLRIRPLPYA